MFYFDISGQQDFTNTGYGLYGNAHTSAFRSNLNHHPYKHDLEPSYPFSDPPFGGPDPFYNTPSYSPFSTSSGHTSSGPSAFNIVQSNTGLGNNGTYSPGKYFFHVPFNKAF